MKHLTTLLFIAAIIFACKNKTDSHIETVSEEIEQPNSNFKDLESDFTKWWVYHSKNISLSSKFIALNEESEHINKNDFLEKLTTGHYIPLKLETLDSLDTYKLFKLDSLAEKEVSTVIKSTSSEIYKRFKMEGTPFPEFSFIDLNGNEYNNQNTKGKRIILKCWFINCVPCIAEFPELNQLVEDHKNNKHILFISLAIDPKSDLEKFLSKKTLNYATIPNQETFMQKTLGVNAYPTHFVINKNGVIEKVVSKSSELISYLETNKISIAEENKNIPPPPPPPLGT